MKFSTAALNLGFLTSALAAPQNARTRSDARRAMAGRPNIISDVKTTSNFNTQYSGNWAGLVHKNPPSGQAFASVSGTFTVQRPTVPIGSTATPQQGWGSSAWVGIDGSTCQSAILQTGVDMSLDQFGTPSYSAWYEWYPAAASNFNNLAIRAGDVRSPSFLAFPITNTS